MNGDEEKSFSKKDFSFILGGIALGLLIAFSINTLVKSPIGHSFLVHSTPFDGFTSSDELFARVIVEDLDKAQGFVENGEFEKAEFVYSYLRTFYWHFFNYRFNQADFFVDEYYSEIIQASWGPGSVDTLKHQRFFYLISDLPFSKQLQEDYCSGRSDVMVANLDCEESLYKLRLWAGEIDAS